MSVQWTGLESSRASSGAVQQTYGSKPRPTLNKLEGGALLTKDFWQLPRQLLACKSNEIGRGNYSNVVEGERPEVQLRAHIVRVNEVDDNGGGHEGP